MRINLRWEWKRFEIGRVLQHVSLDEASKRMASSLFVMLIVVHVILLAWSASLHSPVSVEVASVASGIEHIRTGSFNRFRVNPPLVRSIAAAVVLLWSPDFPANIEEDTYLHRTEFRLGAEFFAVNGDQSPFYFMIARWACIPFSIVGALTCYCWARDIYGTASGLFAMSLWCFSPMILGHGALVAYDVPAASIGVFACYRFDLWLLSGRGSDALAAGIGLGLALLTKLTWIILPPVWMLIIVMQLGFRLFSTNGLRSIIAWIGITCCGVSVLNFGYLCEGVGRPLGSLEFVSSLLGGELKDDFRGIPVGNRFRGTVFENFPSPLPENYLLGIDRQSREFQVERPSYIAGEWRERGSYFYYAYAFLVKTPVGTLLLVGLSLYYACVNYSGFWIRRLSPVLVPAICVFALVSSQKTLGGHSRYMIPCFPFIFIALSGLVYSVGRHGRILQAFSLAACIASIISSMLTFPHSLSYCNFAMGGPSNVRNHLLSTDADWGQDLYYLKEYWQTLGRGTKLSVACTTELDVESWFGDGGCPVVDLLKSDKKYMEFSAICREGDRIESGVYAVSVNQLYGKSDAFRCLKDRSVDIRIGNSVNVYIVP